MRVGKNRRRGRRENQAEKRFLEQAAKFETLIEVIEVLVKDRVEKEVQESKQQLEAEAEGLLERATGIRNAIEQISADTHIAEINALMQRIESEVENLQENFDKLKSFPDTATIDKHLILDERTGISEEMEMFFTQAEDELEDIIRKILQHMIEQNRQTLDDYVNGFKDSMSHLKFLVEQVKEGKQLVNDIDNLQEHIICSYKERLAAIAELKHLIEGSEANDAIIDKFKQMLSNNLRFHEKARDELKTFSNELMLLYEIRTRRRRQSAFTAVFFLSLFAYLQWSIPIGLFLPQWNSIFAFIITGLVFIFINIFLTFKLTMFFERYGYIFKVSEFSLLNFLIQYSTVSLIYLFLVLLLYRFSLRYLYLFLYNLLDFLTQTNPFISLINNVAAIITIIGLLIVILKYLDLLKYFKILIPWASKK